MNMNHKDLLVKIAAIISVLAEVDGSPESQIYIACGMDLEAYESIRSILTSAGLIVIGNHYIRLTEKGRQTAAELNATIQKRNNPREPCGDTNG